MSDTHIVDRNRVLRVVDSESFATAQYKPSGLVDRDTTDFLEITGNADTSDPGIQIAAKNDGDTNVDLAISAKGSGTVTITGAGGITLSGTVTTDSDGATTSGVGAANGATVSAAESTPTIHTTLLTLTATPITIADESGVGQYGAVKIYDFPAGLICILGSVVSGSITAAAPIIDTWDGDIGLGTVATTDAALDTDETNIMQSSATTTAVSKVAAVDAVTTAAQYGTITAHYLDGTATAADLYLNLIIDDNGAHVGAMSATFTGTVRVTWVNLGDN